MADEQAKADAGWMSDVQRAIALILVGGITLCAIMVTVRLVILGDHDALNDMAKTLQAALVNMTLIALGFFFGSTVQKALADAGQQKIVDKLTSATPPGGPVAPVEAVVPTLDALAGITLTDAEKAHFDKLPDDDAKKKFVAMTSEQRAQAIQRGV